MVVGWLGPHSLLSIITLLLILHSDAVPGMEEIQQVVPLAVVSSILLHGPLPRCLQVCRGAS